MGKMTPVTYVTKYSCVLTDTYFVYYIETTQWNCHIAHPEEQCHNNSVTTNATTTASQQHCHNNIFTTKCHNNSVTTTASQQQCHNNSVTTTVSQQQCHNNSVTTTVSQQQCHNNSVTTTVSRQQCHNNSVTTTASQQQCHNSKSVIFQENILKVLKCYNFLWVQRRHNCSPAASFANCVSTLNLFKLHLQTFPAIPVTQKCQISIVTVFF